MDCLSKVKTNYQDKRVLILGLGIQDGGVEAARFFARLGCQVRVSDLKSAEILSPAIQKLEEFPELKLELGQHSAEFIQWADLIVRNPGVPLNSPPLNLARELKKEIIMPSAFLVKNCELETVGITGTRGKSTTTNMVFSLLKQFGPKRTALAGNLPQFSPFKVLADPTVERVVMELSSWELQAFGEMKISPHIAVLTNIYPDHLNFYTSMEEYVNDKLLILKNQQPSDYFVTLESTFKRFPQIKSLVKGKLRLVPDDYFQGTFEHLIGEHNRKNASLAQTVGEILGIPITEMQKVLEEFSGLPFRLEYLGTLKSAAVYNDSTSTTPIAGITALAALSEKFPQHQILSIVGGNDKKLPIDEWIRAVNSNSQHIYLLPGTFSERVIDQLDASKLTQAPDLETLFELALPNLSSKTILLFSPSATSFATFKNEFDRGQQFSAQYQIFRQSHGA